LTDYVVHGKTYPRDDWSNTPPSILGRLPRKLHLDPSHPIGILRSLIEKHLEDYQPINALSPIVTVSENFDDLGFAADHPGRSLTDSYYLNKTHMLRTHTSAHEVATFRNASDRWLLTADVYRRDEIDASHYPVFHQTEGADVLPRSRVGEYAARNAELEARLLASNILITDHSSVSSANPYQASHDPAQAELVTKNLKLTLNSLVLALFGERESAHGEPLQVRWIDAFFPFTSPSYEVEVFFGGKWLEILGCGVINQATLDRSGRSLSFRIL
jgi:phenylalanyl-tRNA synthetase alpha chain